MPELGARKMEIAAVVVLYRPAEEMLTSIDSYRKQVDLVIAVDNTEVPDHRFVAQLESRGGIYIPVGGNTGLAAGLNVGCRRARSLGFDWVLTMDQDSTATPGMVARLAACVEEEGPAGRQLDDGRIAMVAPVWRHPDVLGEATSGQRVDIDAALTSGCLTNLAAFDELGGFREDFFIDRVDSDYCFRARRHGWRIIQQQDAVLVHTIGRPRKAPFPYPFWVADYSPVRRYYMVRNSLELRRQYGQEFPAQMGIERHYWRRELVKIFLAEPQRVQKAAMMIRGWLDYRRGRFGRYEDLHVR